MEHLLGCHGEWLWVMQALAAVPVVGMWVRLQMTGRQGKPS